MVNSCRRPLGELLPPPQTAILDCHCADITYKLTAQVRIENLLN